MRLEVTRLLPCNVRQLENVLQRAFILCDGMLMNLFTHEQQRDAERALRKGGLKELLVQTRELQERDPDCATFPRFKQFDDATGIEIAAAE